ncbi:MAG: type I glutamate--ammonia ligase [Bacillota bacterium]|nr:type I glutamate--ammonia ligase [Bacillota bacterium]
MAGTSDDIMEFINENDVKFIRLQFCDIFGRLKNIAIMPSQLERAFNYGIGFDASSISGFLNIEESDLFLIPEPSTISVLPWRPQQGRVVRFYCNIYRPNGDPFEGDSRILLERAEKELYKYGFTCKIGAECEFYLFNTDEIGHPTTTPHDKAGYFDVAPLDKGENVRREICLTLEEMGITPESSHHESGPGQHEVDFMHDRPLLSADNLITFKSVVQTISARAGLHATFMPKPMIDNSGSGLHINMSLFRGEENLFCADGGKHSEEAESFIAGILDHVAEMTAVLNPLVNSYKRIGEFEAPRFITWSHCNRSPLIRIPAASGNTSRMELRSPDPACNHYMAFALLIHAGLDGIKRKLPLKHSDDINLFTAPEEVLKNIPCLPLEFETALDLFENSSFCKGILGDLVFNKYLAAKRKECADYYASKRDNHKITEFEMSRYFEQC